MAFIELKELVEHIPNRQRLEVLLEDGTPTDIAQTLRIIMINEARVNPLDLVDGLNDCPWRVEVLTLHCITSPCDDSIGGIMGMSWDQVHQHDLRVEQDGEQSKELQAKLRLVLTDTIVKDYEQSF
jgi:hypothetical protein